MAKKAWYYFQAEDRHDTAEYHFRANSTEDAQAKARILYGNREPLYGENLSLINQATDTYHTSIINYLTEVGEDDFDAYMKKNKSNISNMIEVLRLHEL